MEVEGYLDQFQDQFDPFVAGTETVVKYTIRSKDTALNESDDTSEELVVRPVKGSQYLPGVPSIDHVEPGDRRVKLIYSANASNDDIFGFNIFRRENDTDPYEQISTELIKSTTFIDTDTDLVNETTYRYSVSAVDTIGNESEKSVEVLATPDDLYPPSTPLDFEALSGPGGGEITLTWTPVNDVDLDGYKIYRSTVSGSYGTDPINSQLINDDYYTDELTETQQQQDYFYVIKAVDDDENESEASNEVSARPRYSGIDPPTITQAEYVPNENGPDSELTKPNCDPDPDDFQAPGCDPGKGDDDFIEVQLSWDEIADAIEYNIYRKETEEDEPFKKIGTTTETSFIDTQIESDEYIYGISVTKEVTVEQITTVEESANTIVTVEDEFTFEDRPIDLVLYTDICDYNAYCEGDDCTAIRVFWNRVMEMKLLGYNVYRRCSPSSFLGPTPQSCKEKAWLKINSSPVQLIGFKDQEVNDMYTYNHYRYVVTAVSKDGQESGCSPGASITWSICPMEACPGDDNCDILRTCPSEYLCPQLELTDPPDGPPAAPKNVSAYFRYGEHPECGWIDIKWSRNKEEDIDSYNIYISETLGGPYEKINSHPVAIFEREYRDYICNEERDNLCGTLNYYYVLTAVDREGQESPHSIEMDPCNLAPRYPENIQAAPCYDNAIKLTWECANPSSGYNIYRKDSPIGDFIPIATVEGYNNTSYTDSGLTADNLYFYHIKSYNDNGESDASEEVSSYALADPIDPPTNLTSTLTQTETACFIMLDWQNHPDQTILGYNVYRKIGGIIEFSKINEDIVEDSHYRDNDIVMYKGHRYYVTAVAADGTESCRSNEVSKYVGYSPYCKTPGKCIDPSMDILLASQRDILLEENGSNLKKNNERDKKLFSESLDSSKSSQISSLNENNLKSLSHIAAKANYQKQMRDYLAEREINLKNIFFEDSDRRNIILSQNKKPHIKSPSAEAVAKPKNLILSPYERIGTPDPIRVDVYFFHADHLGSIRLITDEEGNEESHHAYFPFGEEIAPMESYNTHQFTGHERDEETGLDYMMARYYRNDIARFVSPDKSFRGTRMEYPQSWNKYSYALNNPLRLIDPNGLAPTLPETWQYLQQLGLVKGTWKNATWRIGANIHRDPDYQSTVVSQNSAYRSSGLWGIGAPDRGKPEWVQDNMQAVNMLQVYRADQFMASTKGLNATAALGKASASILQDMGSFGESMTSFSAAALMESACKSGDMDPNSAMDAINNSTEQTGLQAEEMSEEEIEQEERLDDREVDENGKVYKITDSKGSKTFVIVKYKNKD